MNKKSFKQRLDDFFGISKMNSSFRVEIIAGIATFLAMSYILTVNPNSILHDGTADPRWSSVFIATAFGAIIGTLLMALYAKMPFAQASGMGLNSQVGLMLIGAFGGIAFTLSNALFLVFLSGVVFLLLSIIPIKKDKETGKWTTLRELFFDGMPKAVRIAIPVGIGLFITYIGMQNASIIVGNQYTISELVDFTPLFKGEIYDTTGAVLPYVTAFVCFIGVIIICIFAHYGKKGAVIYGVLIATLIYSIIQPSNFAILADGESWKFWKNFQHYFEFSESEGGAFFTLFTEGTQLPANSLFTCIVIVITFSMIDMFDTMGTVVGCAANAGLVDEEGKPLNYNRIMISDSTATIAGAMLGTSTVTTFVESGTGIAAGGKTGFTSLVTAILFALSIILLPVFKFIPSCAAASALVYVGILMIRNVVNINFKDVKEAAPAFMTIISMVLTYSITNGIGTGIITHVIISLFIYLIDVIKYAFNKNKEGAVKPKFDISIISLITAVLFVIYFCVPKN